ESGHHQWLRVVLAVASLLRRELKFGHFHCRRAASEGRPAFQGRSRQPIPRPVAERRMRWQTPTVCEIQAPLTRRGFLTCVAQVPPLKGPAYSQAPRRGAEAGVFVPNKYHLSRRPLFHGPDL